MPEVRKFKNPQSAARFEKSWRIDASYESDFLHFPHDEWDMEVTFTKKPEPLKPDMWATITYDNHEPERVWIRAIVGDYAWVVDDPQDSTLCGWTERLDRISA